MISFLKNNIKKLIHYILILKMDLKNKNKKEKEDLSKIKIFAVKNNDYKGFYNKRECFRIKLSIPISYYIYDENNSNTINQEIIETHSLDISANGIGIKNIKKDIENIKEGMYICASFTIFSMNITVICNIKKVTQEKIGASFHKVISCYIMNQNKNKYKFDSLYSEDINLDKLVYNKLLKFVALNQIEKRK